MRAEWSKRHHLVTADDTFSRHIVSRISYSAAARRARTGRQRAVLDELSDKAWRAAATAADLREEMRRARRHGLSLRAIAHVAGVSHEQVRRITARR